MFAIIMVDHSVNISPDFCSVFIPSAYLETLNIEIVLSSLLSVFHSFAVKVPIASFL